MTTVAIAGAGGRLGRVVAKTFLDQGYRVIGITRSGKLPEELKGAEGRAAQATDREALIAATEGADIIFNNLNPVYTDWKELCMPMARNIIAAAETHGATHLFPGNLYTFGSPMPEALSETTPFSPSSRKGKIRQEMEAYFAQMSREKRVQTITLRAGDFFGGPGTGSWFDLVVSSRIAKGKFTWPGDPGLVHAWAYLPDLAKAFVSLAAQRENLGSHEVFHFPGHAMTGHQMMAAAERVTGMTLKMSRFPRWVLQIGGIVVPMWREVAEMSYLWYEPHSVVSNRLETAIGLVPHTPLDLAVKETLADLGLGEVTQNLPHATAAAA